MNATNTPATKTLWRRDSKTARPRGDRDPRAAFSLGRPLTHGGTTRIKILCKEDYDCYTLASWVREVSDVLSSELGEDVEVVEEHSDSVEVPEVYVDGELALVGLPGEEGYLMEVLKHAINSIRGARESEREPQDR